MHKEFQHLLSINVAYCGTDFTTHVISLKYHLTNDHTWLNDHSVQITLLQNYTNTPPPKCKFHPDSTVTRYVASHGW